MGQRAAKTMTKKQIKESSSKAFAVRTKDEAIALHESLTSCVDIDRWLDDTKNGAFKLSVSKPENKSDVHGWLKAGEKVFYLVSAGMSKTAIEISFRSYMVYVLKLKAIAEKLANFPTFEEWKAKEKSYLDGLRVVGVTEEQIRALYDNKKAKLGTLDESESDDD